MYTFTITSTTSVSDHSDNINEGDTLYDGVLSNADAEDREIFANERQATDYGEAVLSGIDGGRAFNAARDTATVTAREV
jgi:hypothetical protein